MTDELGRKVSIVQVRYDRVTDDGRVANVYIQHTDPTEHWRSGTDEKDDPTVPTPVEEPLWLLRCEAAVPPYGINEYYWPSHVRQGEWKREHEFAPYTFVTIDKLRWWSNPGLVGVDYLDYSVTTADADRLGLGDVISIIRVAPL